MDIIKQLQDNEKPFGLMSEEMQAKAKEIGIASFSELGLGGSWLSLPTIGDKEWYEGTTYRLRPGYEEKPEIVKCEVKREGGVGHLMFVRLDNSNAYELSDAINQPDFIGFKYEGSSDVFTSPRLYRWNDNGLYTEILHEHVVSGKAEVLTPTHVLFRKG